MNEKTETQEAIDDEYSQLALVICALSKSKKPGDFDAFIESVEKLENMARTLDTNLGIELGKLSMLREVHKETVTKLADTQRQLQSTMDFALNAVIDLACKKHSALIAEMPFEQFADELEKTPCQFCLNEKVELQQALLNREPGE